MICANHGHKDVLWNTHVVPVFVELNDDFLTIGRSDLSLVNSNFSLDI